MFVDEQPHELGYGQHRMGVVELDHDLVGKDAPVAVTQPEPTDDVPQRASDEEILLLEPQFLARRRAVTRIQNLGEVFRAHPRLDRLRVVTGVEQGQVE